MNYYSHHIGDHLTDTAHLSILEDGAYRRLMDRYYSTEQALPADELMLFRLLRARSDDEKEAVRVVLVEFFVLRDGFYCHKRCDAEILAYQEKSEKAAKAANKRWSKSDEHDNAIQSAINQECERNANAMRTQCQPITNNQEPITKNQEPINPTPSTVVTEPEGGGFVKKPEVELSIAFRSFGIKTQPANPKLIELARQGVTVDLVKAACEEAKSAKPDAGFNYVVVIIERWCKEAAQLRASGAMSPNSRASPRGESASDKRRNWMDKMRGSGNGRNGDDGDAELIDIN